MEDIKLIPCPVCGKMPKIRYSGAPGYGLFITIQCKPFLRKPHLKVEEGKASPRRAWEYAAKEWNRKAYTGWVIGKALCK